MSNLRITERARNPGTGSAFDSTNIDSILVKLSAYFNHPISTNDFMHSQRYWGWSDAFPLLLFSKQTRAGSHQGLPSKKIDVSAFSYSKSIPRTSPDQFKKKGTGMGGMLVPIQTEHLLHTQWIHRHGPHITITFFRLPDQTKSFLQQKQRQLSAKIENRKLIDL